MSTKQEQFEERQSAAMDCEQIADEIQSAVRKSELLNDFDAVKELSKDIRDSVSCALSCENEIDLNLKNISDALPKLLEALKEAKKEARREKDTVAVACIEEVKDSIKELKRELAELLPEEEG